MEGQAWNQWTFQKIFIGIFRTLEMLIDWLNFEIFVFQNFFCILLFWKFVKGTEIRHLFFLKAGFVFLAAAATRPKAKSTSLYKLLRVRLTCFVMRTRWCKLAWVSPQKSHKKTFL